MSTAASVAKLMGFDEERVEDLKTAVAEACINAMEHGNKLDEALSVGVILSVGADSLEVKVVDTGSGAPGQTPRPISTRRCRRKKPPRHGHVSDPGSGGRSRMGEFAADRKLRAHGDSPQQAEPLIPIRLTKRAGIFDGGTRNKGKDGRDSRRATGRPITVLRFAGDITSTSQAAVLGTYQGLPESAKRILLDFSKVEYLNSSGIALVIQMMIAANKRGQTIQTFGLTPHFQKVFTMVGITKYTKLHPDEKAACAAFSDPYC